MNFQKSTTGRPECKEHFYRLNEQTGYFEKQRAPFGFLKLPGELKLQPSIRTDYKSKGARFILRSRITNGKYLFHTGLIPIGNGNLFFSDHYHAAEGAKNSFCLFRFNAPSTELTIYYFNHFKLYPKQRARFIADFLKRLS